MIESIKKMDEMFKRRATQITEAKEKGIKLIGYVCSYTPPEIIYAAGAIPIRLARGGEQEISFMGEEYSRHACCPFVKSCLGYRMEGKDPFYRMVDQLWTTHSCDYMRSMPEIWHRYLSVPTYMISLPRMYDRETGLELFLTDLETGIKKLEKLTQNKVTEDKLEESISIYNKTRTLLQRLYKTRKEVNPPITGKDTLRLIQYSFYLDPKEYNLALEGVIEELEEMVKEGKGEYNGKPLRIMLSGSIIAMGDEKIIDLIEKEDRTTAIVAEDMCTGARYFQDVIELRNSPLKSIAQAYLRKIPCARMRPNIKRYDFIKKLSMDFNVHGLVYYTLKFCFNYRTESYRIIKEMEKIDIPVLHLETDYSNADIGQLNTRIAAFCEVLEERR